MVAVTEVAGWVVVMAVVAMAAVRVEEEMEEATAVEARVVAKAAAG